MAQVTHIDEYVLIWYQSPYKSLASITGFTDNATGESLTKTFNREFRWSTDGETYCDWLELSPVNLGLLDLSPTELWFQYRYTVAGIDDNVVMSVSDVELTVTHLVPDYSGILKPYGSNCESCSPGELLVIQNNGCFNPYDVNPAICFYKEINTWINKRFGFDTQYYRTVPQQRSKDVILNEYTIYNVSEPKCTKVVINNNELPENKINFDLQGLQYEPGFEVHIDKTYWEDLWGADTKPQEGDIVYIPMMDRIYEIESAFLFRDFMYKPVYYRVSLKKYTPKPSAHIMPIQVDTQLNDLTVSHDELFSAAVTDESIKLSNPQQFTVFTIDNDPVRESVDKTLKIENYRFENNFTIISHNYYDLKKLWVDGSNGSQTAVTYKSLSNGGNSEDRSIAFWINRRSETLLTKTISSVTNDVTNVQFTYSGTVNLTYFPGDKIWVQGTTLYDGLQTILSVGTSTITLDLTYSGGIVNSNWKTTGVKEEIILDGWDSGNGIKLNIYGNYCVKLIVNSDEFIYNIGNPLFTQADTLTNWYGFVINISNAFKQASLFVWKLKFNPAILTPQSGELDSIIQKTFTWSGGTFNSGVNWKLMSSNSWITNLRIFKKTVEVEKQPLILNQNIVKDAHLAIVIDNAKPILTLPKFADPL